jgi:hypothetical protein
MFRSNKRLSRYHFSYFHPSSSSRCFDLLLLTGVSCKPYTPGYMYYISLFPSILVVSLILVHWLARYVAM